MGWTPNFLHLNRYEPNSAAGLSDFAKIWWPVSAVWSRRSQPLRTHVQGQRVNISEITDTYHRI